MRDLKTRGIEIEYAAPQSVRDVIASLGRTEDIRFSPNNRQLAVAAFLRNRIAIFDIDVASSLAGTRVALTGCVELSSPALDRPHGLDFIDDCTLIVSNRGGGVVVFRLPTGRGDAPGRPSLPVETLAGGGTSLVKTPGSVCVAGVDGDRCEILVCNNYEHTVTRHVLESSARCAARSSEVLLRKWLAVPDGVSVSRDRTWIAVSNHSTHSVLLYANRSSLHQDADPDGILRCVNYPHGVRFSSDGRHLFVADAGAPHLHVFARDEDEWRGVRQPLATFRIMDVSVFLRGRRSVTDGGPKGIDLDVGSNVLVVTSQSQPLAFFDVRAMLERASPCHPEPTRNESAPLQVGAIDEGVCELSRREQRALEVAYELHALNRTEARARAAEAAVVYMTNSRSWRVTALFRRLYSALRRHGWHRVPGH